MTFGSREFIRRRRAGKLDQDRDSNPEVTEVTRKSSEEERASALAIHQTSVQMLERMATALERKNQAARRKNQAARQGLTGGLSRAKPR